MPDAEMVSRAAKRPAGGIDIELRGRDVELGIGRDRVGGDGADLEFGVGGNAGARKGGDDGGLDVVAGDDAAGPFEDYAIAAGVRPPVDAVIARDGGELGGRNRDASARGRGGGESLVVRNTVPEVGQVNGSTGQRAKRLQRRRLSREDRDADESSEEGGGFHAFTSGW